MDADKDQLIQEILTASKMNRHVIPTRKDDLCRDMCDLIRKTDWSVDNIKDLYQAIIGKTVSKCCGICRRLTSVFEGEQRHVNADLSRPKQFVCKGCASRM